MTEIANKAQQLKYIARTETGRSSFSAVSSSSRYLSASPRFTQRIHSAPPDRQTRNLVNESLGGGIDISINRSIHTISASVDNGVDELYPLPGHLTPTDYRPETARSTISTSLDNGVKDPLPVEPLPDHLASTQYRTETARSTKSRALVNSPNKLVFTIPGKYEAPPLAEEDFFAGKERPKSGPSGWGGRKTVYL